MNTPPNHYFFGHLQSTLAIFEAQQDSLRPLLISRSLKKSHDFEFLRDKLKYCPKGNGRTDPQVDHTQIEH
jgi:hypothetical protein